MSEYFYLKRASINKALETECVIKCDIIEDGVILHISDPELGEEDFSGIDFFEALQKVRCFLEGKGFLLLCAGSKPNVYPSSMLRSRTNGRKAFLHAYRKKPNMNDIVDIFEPAKKDEVGTLYEQEKFMKDLHNYFKNLNDEA